MTSTYHDKVCVREEDAIRLIIEFLSRRDLCISQLSLERESGIYNCNFSDDLIFLRQLILDGQWEDVLQFVSPLKSIESFSSRKFQFLIYKHKYVELLCIRSEAGALSQAVEVGVNDIIECLNQLEKCAPDRDHYNKLSSLLTIPNLNDDEELKNWNPNSWRLKCFHDVIPLVEKFMQPFPSIYSQKQIAKNDRLMNLVFKGLLYEVCLRAIKYKLDKSAKLHEFPVPDVMNGIESTLNLNSFIESLPENFLETYFSESKFKVPMNLDIEKHDKPALVASWSEMILSTPIKPNVFPHSSVPYTRIKAADLMSKSLSSSLMLTANTKDLMTLSVCDIAQFSRSTLASTGFHLNEEMKDNNSEKCDTMTVSMDKLFKGADVFITSKGLVTDNFEFINGLPTITENPTPTDSNKDEDNRKTDIVVDKKDEESENDIMNQSYLDIWMKQHQLKNRSMSIIPDYRKGSKLPAKMESRTAALERSSIMPISISCSIRESSLSSTCPTGNIGNANDDEASSTMTGRALNHAAIINSNMFATPVNKNSLSKQPLTGTSKTKKSINSIKGELLDEHVLWYSSSSPSNEKCKSNNLFTTTTTATTTTTTTIIDNNNEALIQQKVRFID